MMDTPEHDTHNVASGWIGVVLSGGGSRAAAFHFGSFEYLDRRGLMPRVRMISTVSGGTFIGAKYALCLAHGQDFNGFFAEFYDNLLRTRALADTLRKLADLPEAGEGYSVPSKRRDLIVCAAQTYADTFLRRGADGPCYLLGDLMNPPPDYPLEEVVFNTTEYRTGVAFRFQRHGRLGNVNVCPPPDKMECAKCAAIVDAPKEYTDTCPTPGCGVALRACRQCEFFHPEKGCRNAAVMRKSGQVADTEALNKCEWFDARPVSPEVLERMREEAACVRIADVVAASSCLPGVFGPLGFPDDFAWPDGKVPDTLRAVFSHGGKPRPLTLMDGGIYDNQGIESLMLADQQVDRDTLTQNVLSGVLDEGRVGGGGAGAKPAGSPRSRLDAVIVSDADRREENILPYEQQYVDRSVPDAPRGLTLGTLSLLAWFLMVVCIVAALVATGNLVSDFFFNDATHWWETLLYVVALVLAGGTGWTLRWLRLEFDILRRSVPQGDETTWEKIKQVRTRSLRDSVRLGVAGIGKTVNAVMPKRMRELGYWIFYTDPNYAGKRISNLIYHLQSGNSDARLRMCEFLDRHGLPIIGEPLFDPRAAIEADTPGAGLQAIIDAAATMDTRFWFEPAPGEPPEDRGRGELDRVLVCGQATMCFNLMKFIDRIHGPDPSVYPPDVAELWSSLTGDWRALYFSPYSLIDERFQRAGMQVPASRR